MRRVRELERGEDWVLLDVRAGSQTNCGGWARIHVIVRAAPDLHCLNASADEVPPELVAEVFAGAREGFQASGTCGELTLVRAFVHPVDGNGRTFRAAGHLAAAYGWREEKKDERGRN